MARRRRSSSIPDLADITSALNMHRSRSAALLERVQQVQRDIAAIEADLGSVGSMGKRRGRPPGSKNKPKGRAGKPAKATRRGRPTGAGRRRKGEDLNSYIAKVLGGASKP